MIQSQQDPKKKEYCVIQHDHTAPGCVFFIYLEGAWISYSHLINNLHGDRMQKKRSKHETFIQRWVIVGPTSKTLVQW